VTEHELPPDPDLEALPRELAEHPGPFTIEGVEAGGTLAGAMGRGAVRAVVFGPWCVEGGLRLRLQFWQSLPSSVPLVGLAVAHRHPRRSALRMRSLRRSFSKMVTGPPDT